MRVRKAVIPAAGLGTRFLPATKAQPKEMLPIIDTPIIHHVVNEAVQAGIEDLLIIIGRNKFAIEDHFDHSVELETFLERGQQVDLLRSMCEISEMVNIHFIRQKQPKGLGHAVYQAHQHIGNEPFAVLLGDEIFSGQQPCLAQLLRQREIHGGSIIAGRQVPMDEVHRYGVVDAVRVSERVHRVANLIEKPTVAEAPSNLAIVGRYVLDPEIFSILSDLPSGRNGEIQLTDALQILAQRKPIFAYEAMGRRYDVGDKFGYLQATVEFALARPGLAKPFRRYLKSLLRSDGGDE